MFGYAFETRTSQSVLNIPSYFIPAMSKFQVAALILLKFEGGYIQGTGSHKIVRQCVTVMYTYIK